MSIFAMSFFAIPMLMERLMLFPAYRDQVKRVTAKGVFANVVQFFSSREESFISNTVSVESFSVDACGSVSLDGSSHPYPAIGILIDGNVLLKARRKSIKGNLKHV